MPRRPLSTPKTSESSSLQLRFDDFPTGTTDGFHRVLTAKGMTASADAFARTPLFGAKEKPRILLQANEEVVVVNDQDGYQVVLCGGLNSALVGPYGCMGQVVSSRFDQTDYTVFLGLLQLAGGRLGAPADFEPYAFAKTLGLSSGDENVKTVFRSILRMAETRIAVRSPSLTHPGTFIYSVGRLVSSIQVADADGIARYCVCLDPCLAGLFKPAYFSSLSWAHRLAIKGSLARWLHAELNSHKSGRFRWSQDLQTAFNATSPPSLFRARLRDAAAEVSRVTGWSIRFVKNGTNHNEKLVFFKTTEAVARKSAASRTADDSDEHDFPPTAESGSEARTRYGFPGPRPTQH